VTCVVTATGISTSKGKLVSAILYPRKLTFSYDVELAVVISILALYSTAICAVAVILLQNNGSEMPFVTTWV
jgi:magnesium-transporting ATPase (P-type)